MKGLEVQDLRIDFPDYQISSEDFTVKPGEFLAVDAPSGFGKTTFLRALMGFQKMASGEIRLEGKSIALLPSHLRHFGVVFQDHLLFPHLDAWENALFGVKLRGKVDEGAKRRAEQAFEALELGARRKAKIQELSGGERQRLALLRATLFDPEALILDEPLKGLDAHAIQLVSRYLQELISIRPIPVIWVSHHGMDHFPGGRIIGTEQTGQRRFTHDRAKSQTN